MSTQIIQLAIVQSFYLTLYQYLKVRLFFYQGGKEFQNLVTKKVQWKQKNIHVNLKAKSGFVLNKVN